jgi:pimeloyl-ACP methyl ester carboxylesterase
VITYQERKLQQMEQQGKLGIVFIYGAGLNRWIWDKVADGLGYPCLAVDFPLRREGGSAHPGELALEHYAAYIIRQIEAWGVDKFVLVAHSLGGVPALRVAAAMPERVAGFVAVGAVIPPPGGSFLSHLPWLQRLIMSAVLRKVGTRPPESAIRSGLCRDLPPELASDVVRGFVPEAVRVYTDPVGAPAPRVPSLYVKLNKDNQLRPSRQDTMIKNLSPQYVAGMDTGHLPMLSDPEGLRRILQGFVSEVATPWADLESAR